MQRDKIIKNITLSMKFNLSKLQFSIQVKLMIEVVVGSSYKLIIETNLIISQEMEKAERDSILSTKYYCVNNSMNGNYNEFMADDLPHSPTLLAPGTPEYF